jgi:hypothetical protein
MATDCIPQVVFKFDKLVVAKLDAEHRLTFDRECSRMVRARGGRVGLGRARVSSGLL